MLGVVYWARSSLETQAKRNDQLGKWLRCILETEDRPVDIVALSVHLARNCQFIFGEAVLIRTSVRGFSLNEHPSRSSKW